MWAFIVCRNNVPEQVRFFDDYWSGSKHADLFIEHSFPDMKDKEMPNYNRGEYFYRDTVSIGMYKSMV